MIISPSELKELDSFVNKYLEREKDDHSVVHPDPEFLPMNFFGARPHMLMLLGFDEYRVVHRSDPDLQRFSKIYQEDFCPGQIEFESMFRFRSSGAWVWFEGIGNLHGKKMMPTDHLTFHPPMSKEWGERLMRAYELSNRTGDKSLLGEVQRERKPEQFSLSGYVETVRNAVARCPEESFALFSPKLWTPAIQRLQRLRLSENVSALLSQLRSSVTSLTEISPRQLEEIVAELLRAKGMEIYVTPQSHDGGRDIIARGELIPGEPCVLAVEAKQKSVTGLADVQRALQANKDFSHLLVATSGRFSSGVVREKRKPENEFRLLLKDGIRNAFGSGLTCIPLAISDNPASSLIPHRR